MAESGIYHEKQSLQHCAIHSLNNLLQDCIYTKQQLDEICENLSPDTWINPHRSMIGLGNYDINVIISALQLQNFTMIWYDKRKNLSNLILSNIYGFIVNYPSKWQLGKFQLPSFGKHWVALREISGLYYDLDSKLDSPAVIGREKEVMQYLASKIECVETQLFIIVTNDVAKSESWELKDNYTADAVEQGEMISADNRGSETDFNGKNVNS